MTPNEAAKLIGEPPRGDYALDLAAHTERYKDIAALATLLRSARLSVIRERY